MNPTFKPWLIKEDQLTKLDEMSGQFIITSDTKKIYIDSTKDGRILVGDKLVKDVTIEGNVLTITNNDDTTKELQVEQITYSPATTTTDGLMSSTDKAKLDGIEANANDYSLPVASNSVLGGVCSGGDISVDQNGNVSVIDNSHNHTIENVTGLEEALDDKIAISQKGVAGGVAILDAGGRVPTSQLPSYVDDVIEGYKDEDKFYFDSQKTDEIVGESDKIYVDQISNRIYRWSGTAFVEISSSLAIGETPSTAFSGDKGKVAYDHALIKEGNPHGTTKADLGLESVEDKSSAQIRDELTSDNVVDALGFLPPEQDTTYELVSTTEDGLMSSEDKVKLDEVEETYIKSLEIEGSNLVYTKGNDETETLNFEDLSVTADEMVGATEEEDGLGGSVPAPTKGEANRYLRSDGTWVTPPNNTVTQVNNDDDNWKFILFSSDSSSETETAEVNKSTKLQYNPLNGCLWVAGIQVVDITGKQLDLNTHSFSTGKYHIRRFICKTDAGAENIANKPTSSAFILEVESIRYVSETDFITMQKAIVGVQQKEYRRYCVSGEWTEWKECNFTNTWRPVQNNLTSTSTTDSLSAAQGKILADKIKALEDWKASVLAGSTTVVVQV